MEPTATAAAPVAAVPQSVIDAATFESAAHLAATTPSSPTAAPPASATAPPAPESGPAAPDSQPVDLPAASSALPNNTAAQHDPTPPILIPSTPTHSQPTAPQEQTAQTAEQPQQEQQPHEPQPQEPQPQPQSPSNAVATNAPPVEKLPPDTAAPVTAPALPPEAHNPTPEAQNTTPEVHNPAPDVHEHEQTPQAAATDPMEQDHAEHTDHEPVVLSEQPEAHAPVEATEQAVATLPEQQTAQPVQQQPEVPPHEAQPHEGQTQDPQPHEQQQVQPHEQQQVQPHEQQQVQPHEQQQVQPHEQQQVQPHEQQQVQPHEQQQVQPHEQTPEQMAQATLEAPEVKPEEKPRRTRMRLTVAQKVDVLKRLKKGERQSALAAELGCSKRALARLKQESASFEHLQLTEADSHRKSRHSVKHVVLETKLSYFLRLARRNSFPISGNSIRKAALKIRDDLLVDPNLPENEHPGLVAFQASINWSKGFIKRCGIRALDSKHEPAPMAQQVYAKQQLEKVLNEFDLDCIFCVDRSVLFYTILPNESFIQLQSDGPSSGPPPSLVEERVVMVLATNVTGSVKIPPAIIGKESVPQCFRDRPCPLPYLSHSHAWIDDNTFKTWFYCVLVPAVRRSTSKRVAVIVDADWAPINICDSHGQVQIIALSQDLEPSTHPMNSGIVSVFRRSLRYSTLQRMIRIVDVNGHEFQELPESTASMRGMVIDQENNLLTLADTVNEAWNNLSEMFITRCWAKSGILPQEQAARLVQSIGTVAASSDEQMFFSSCSARQIERIRAMEDMIINRRLFNPPNATQRARDLVTSLHESGRRGLDSWLELESSPRAQRALAVELDHIVGEFTNPIVPPRTPAKRKADGSVVGESEESVKDGKVPLPHLGYMMDLLAPIEKVLEECECGNAGLLLRNLKHELVRVKSDQDGLVNGTEQQVG